MMSHEMALKILEESMTHVYEEKSTTMGLRST